MQAVTGHTSTACKACMLGQYFTWIGMPWAGISQHSALFVKSEGLVQLLSNSQPTTQLNTVSLHHMQQLMHPIDDTVISCAPMYSTMNMSDITSSLMLIRQRSFVGSGVTSS